MRRWIILTKSPMHKYIGDIQFSGVCVVAYDPETRALVRFVQAPEGGPVSGRCVSTFDLLDEVEADPLESVPEPPQTENVLIPKDGIRRVGPGTLSIGDIFLRCRRGGKGRYMADTKPSLDAVDSYDHSVELCRATDLHLRWEAGKNRPRASFNIGNQHHRSYRVTDQRLERRVGEPMPERSQHIPEAYLLVSIPSVPFDQDGLYYKFIAAVYPVDPLPRSAPAAAEKDAPVSPEKAAPGAAKGQGMIYREKTLARGMVKAWQPWSPEEDAALQEEFARGLSVAELSRLHCRTTGAIHSRLVRLGLLHE